MPSDKTETLADQQRDRYREWLKDCQDQEYLINLILDNDPSGRKDDVFMDAVRDAK